MVGTANSVRPFDAVFRQDPMISSSKSLLMIIINSGATGTTLASLWRTFSLISAFAAAFLAAGSPLFFAILCQMAGTSETVAVNGSPHIVKRRMWLSSHVPRKSCNPIVEFGAEFVFVDVDVAV